MRKYTSIQEGVLRWFFFFTYLILARKHFVMIFNNRKGKKAVKWREKATYGSKWLLSLGKMVSELKSYCSLPHWASWDPSEPVECRGSW